MYTYSSVSFFTALLLIAGMADTVAQNIPPTTAKERLQSVQHRQKMRQSSVFKEYPVRNIGPVVMSGRVTDIAVDEKQPRVFYVAFASGGVFKTVNSGNTMKPVFDHQGTLTIGDIAFSKADKNVLWVGTGENNSSRSSYAGTGVYRSTDGGKTWNFTGLAGTQHVGRIVTHPTDPDIAWVASQGPLYSVNEARGVYKTTDGGQSWKKTLSPPDSTGVIDLLIHPDNPKILWATTWQRFRQAWNFQESGTGSGIYKSTDGGETWKRSMKGFPEGEHVGRIGIDVSRSNPEILYAFLDNQYVTKTEKKDEGKEGLTQADFLGMSQSEFFKVSDKELEAFLRRNSFPKKYTAKRVKLDVQRGEYKPKALAEYLGDANAALFDTDITGAEVYKSEDGGQSWSKINSYSLDNLIYTYGYYFGEIRVSPSNPNVVYAMGVPALRSDDGGITWKPIAENQQVHVDHHAMWIDPNDPAHVLLGNDGGLYESHDAGENFIHHNVAPVGQFYTVAVDMKEPYNVYGGLQDNGVFTGPSNGSSNDGEHWQRLFGGDGMHVAVDPRDSDIVYTGFQFGNYYKIDRDSGKRTRITPRHEIGEPRYRFNWNTPLEMSNHNPDIIYFGSQLINRSFDGGETWKPVSPDLTNDLPNGDVPYSTITTIAESPVDFNIIWAGTDDGNVQVTRNGGNTWHKVSDDLPARRWVSEVHASRHNPAAAYVSLNGYRYDEFKTYVFKTTDFGQSWTSVKGNLPDDVVNIIVEDPEIPELLYAGLDHGTYVSFNDGEEWHLLNGIPNVASYDMVIHPRELDLVVGTHGRSVYVTDLEPIHEISHKLENVIVGIEPEPVDYSSRWGSQSAPYREVFEPNTSWLYWIGDKKAKNKSIAITVKDSNDKIIAELKDIGNYGFNAVDWNLRTDDDKENPEYLKKGTYTVAFTVDKQTDEISLEVK